MNEIIENIYTFKSEQGTSSYIYSLRKEEDYLGYDYYFLTKDPNNNPIIYETINPIFFLQNNQLNIIPIQKNTVEYKEFLNELSIAKNNIPKKEEVLSRK